MSREAIEARDRLRRTVLRLEAENASLREQLQQSQEREQALAAHVERLHSTLEPFARAWQQREPVGDHNSKGYQRRLERALLPFYSTGNVDEFSLTGEHLREAARALSAPVGATRLTRLKAEWQVEGRDKERERCVRLAEAYMARLPDYNPDDENDDLIDKVEEGYGNACLNLKIAIQDGRQAEGGE